MLNNRKKTFESLENLLQRRADKIILYLSIPKQDGLVAEDEIDWLDEAMKMGAYVLNNLEKFSDSRQVHEHAGIIISCDINDMFSLDIECGCDDDNNIEYYVDIEAICDWDDDDWDEDFYYGNVDLYHRVIPRQGRTGKWHHDN